MRQYVICESFPTFRWNAVHPSLGVKMPLLINPLAHEDWGSAVLRNVWNHWQRQIPEGLNPQLRRCGNIRTCNFNGFYVYLHTSILSSCKWKYGLIMHVDTSIVTSLKDSVMYKTRILARRFGTPYPHQAAGRTWLVSLLYCVQPGCWNLLN